MRFSLVTAHSGGFFNSRRPLLHHTASASTGGTHRILLPLSDTASFSLHFAFFRYIFRKKLCHPVCSLLKQNRCVPEYIFQIPIRFQSVFDRCLNQVEHNGAGFCFASREEFMGLFVSGGGYYSFRIQVQVFVCTHCTLCLTLSVNLINIPYRLSVIQSFVLFTS